MIPIIQNNYLYDAFFDATNYEDLRYSFKNKCFLYAATIFGIGLSSKKFIVHFYNDAWDSSRTMIKISHPSFIINKNGVVIGQRSTNDAIMSFSVYNNNITVEQIELDLYLRAEEFVEYLLGDAKRKNVPKKTFKNEYEKYVERYK